jgi:transposase
MWTPTTRAQHSRAGLRYGSDLTDAEWAMRRCRAASLFAAVLDSQSAKTAEAGGPRGYDAGKKVKGRKRHAPVDTDGRALKLHDHPADVLDRDGAIPLLRASRRSFPFVARVFADSASAGKRVARATRIAIEIVRKTADQVGFQVHKRRWVVERFFARIGRNRRQPTVRRFNLPSDISTVGVS